MSAVRVVPALPDDASAIAELECRPENVPYVRGHPAAEHRARMDDPTVRYLRIEDSAGAFIGFGLVTELGGTDRSARLLRIVMDAPGRGLGRLAMNAICTLVFDTWGIERFWLDVFEDNARAHHLYQSLGFRATGHTHHPSHPRGDGGTAPLMRMELWAREHRSI
ncbi:MAG TPA: GNAT family N-acetyltransferase [Stellaceae bacterium]|nr:GNAT family N-acetyltransferase [Stellaceae bacterium]